MKICYISNASHIHTQRWVKYFANRGHDVHLISISHSRNGDIGKAELHVLKRFPVKIKIISFLINLLLYTMQIRKLVKKIKPDVLHAHYAGDYGFWGALSGFHPLVLTAMGSDILVKPRKSRIYHYFIKFVLKRADLITCSGQNVIMEAIGLGAEPNKIKLIHRGVDTRKFRARNNSADGDHKIFDSPVVISNRNLNPIYDVETVIRSIPSVLEQVPNVTFVIIGDGTQKNYLEDLAKSLDIMDSISFIGQIPHDQIPGYLAAADVYVSTSLSDSGPSVSLPEAIACGVAPVVTDVGDVRKWIEDGENGFVIPIKRPDLLAEKIIYLLNNKGLRDKMAKANRPLVEERANYEKEMGKMDELYKELMRRSTIPDNSYESGHNITS